MILYMTQIAVADFAASLAWYRDGLGLAVVHLDEPHRFALLQGRTGGRLALKEGVANPAGVLLHFEVPSLTDELVRLAERGVVATGPVTVSGEGYRSVPIADPDGRSLILFEWAR